ncbi:MAG: HAD-IB family phosphatase, partial [Enterobacteriaceae bacterium]
HDFKWKVALISGGFTYFADHLGELLQLDAVEANQLELSGGHLTGKVLEPIVDAHYKAQWLRTLAESLEIPLQQTVAIGDGANDLEMLRTAGLGIAYHAKPKVVAQAKVAIRHADLLGVLCILSSQLQHEEK